MGCTRINDPPKWNSVKLSLFRKWFNDVFNLLIIAELALILMYLKHKIIYCQNPHELSIDLYATYSLLKATSIASTVGGKMEKKNPLVATCLPEHVHHKSSL